MLRDYKFCNVFRELDHGTVKLRDMVARATSINPSMSAGLIVWNVAWYRLWNWHEHALMPGFCEDVNQWEQEMLQKRDSGTQMFTGAHMQCGHSSFSCKTEAMIDTAKKIYEQKEKLVEVCRLTRSLQHVFKWMRAQKWHGVGPFFAYEIVTDLRWCIGALTDAVDILTWANVGPGAARGLRRLEMPETVKSMRNLWELARLNLGDHVTEHIPHESNPHCLPAWPPFEMREIEHSLCELDKYERIRTGASKHMEKYDWQRHVKE